MSVSNVDEKVWAKAALHYRAVAEALENAKAEESAARAALIQLAPKGYEGDGLRLSRVISEGRVAYKKVVDELLPNIDLEPWRGEPSTSYRVDDLAKKEAEKAAKKASRRKA